jgi:hypothetical protein
MTSVNLGYDFFEFRFHVPRATPTRPDAPNRLPNSDWVSFRFRRNLSICRDHSGTLAAFLGRIFVTRLKLHWQACLAQEYSLQFFRY